MHVCGACSMAFTPCFKVVCTAWACHHAIALMCFHVEEVPPFLSRAIVLQHWLVAHASCNGGKIAIFLFLWHSKCAFNFRFYSRNFSQLKYTFNRMNDKHSAQNCGKKNKNATEFSHGSKLMCLFSFNWNWKWNSLVNCNWTVLRELIIHTEWLLAKVHSMTFIVKRIGNTFGLNKIKLKTFLLIISL